ncbi:MAG: hypothetical protein EPO46_10940 [Lysobacter sp.]|nr:MAG: hypothetical protein EPO46_10940 [Lysobacter sp.]
MRAGDTLRLGWRAHPWAAVAYAMAIAIVTLLALRLGGPVVAGIVAALGLLIALPALQGAWLDGPLLCLRDIHSRGLRHALHARSVDALQFRRMHGPLRLRLECGGIAADTTLVLCGPDPGHATFRAILLWLIVHGRRRVHVDTCLLDALAVIPEHAGAGSPHDASHA